MRICPKCGHADHPMWRPRNSRVFCEFTKSDTLEFNNYKLWFFITENHPELYYDGHFIYHLTKGKNIERIEKELYDFMKFGQEPQEKIDHSIKATIKSLNNFLYIICRS